MTRSERWLCVSDVDDTLLGDNFALAQLAAEIAAKDTRPSLVLVYNSSRPCSSLLRTLELLPLLPVPDYLIGALGTQLQQVSGTAPLQLRSLPDYGHQWATNGWQRDRILSLIAPFHFEMHPDEFQTEFKVSFTVPDAAAAQQVSALLEQQNHNLGIAARAIVSGNGNFDIIPRSAGKQYAIQHLQQQLRIGQDCVIVAGDSENDIDMFTLAYKGIVVGNAVTALKQLAQNSERIYQAAADHAAGVFEGLRYWEVI